MDRLEDRMEAEVAFMAWRGTVPPGCGTLARLLLEAKEMASSRSRSSARVWNQSRVDFFRIFSHWNYLQSSSAFHLHLCTLFENHPKCRIGIFQFWHFSSIFVLLKLSYLVTLFDSKFWHF